MTTLRSLRRAPGIVTVTILTLALGVGANTAIFSLVHGILLKPLAFPAPERLIALGEGRTDGPQEMLSSTSPGSFFDWRASARSASGMAAYTTRGATRTANLSLARATSRQHEMAIRQALGAGWFRQVRQLLIESLLLSLAGAVAAVAVARLMMRLLVESQRASLPRIDDVALDPTVLAFTLAVAVAAGLVFGLAPAVQLARGRSSDVLREGGRGGERRAGGRRSLVVAELALALMLLIGAGLLLRSFSLLTRVEPGLDTHGLIAAQMRVRGSNPAFIAGAIERLAAIPGVNDVAVTSQVPLTGRGIGAWFSMYARPVPAGTTPPAEAYRVVSPGFFETARIPLLRGRMLEETDGREGTLAVVVNEALARRYFPEGDAIGQDIYLGAPDNRLFDRATIVGVVGDTRDRGGHSAGADPAGLAARSRRRDGRERFIGLTISHLGRG